MMRRRSVARRGGPGLVGTVARTAVIAGTAQATANAVNSRAASKQRAAASAVEQQNAVADLQAQVEQLQVQEAQAQMPAAPAPEAGGQSDLITKLTQLGELHAAGILTDEEFVAAKAKALS